MVKERNQQLVLNKDGFILESNDTIFSTQHLKNRAATEWSPFLESIFSPLQSADKNTIELQFDPVESDLDFLSGFFFKYTFIHVEFAGEPAIVWSIEDYTYDCQRIKTYQQYHHESIIQREIRNTNK